MAQYWYSEARGRRPSMEDIHITQECPVSKWILFAVCDGHGGTGVVKYLERMLGKRILQALQAASLENAAMQGPKVPSTKVVNPYAIPVRPSYLRQHMKRLIVSIDRELERELKSTEARGSGSTLIMMAYQPLTRQIILVNLGDSRAVLSFPQPTTADCTTTTTTTTGSAKRQLIETKDHKPNDKEELTRVIAAGSFVSKNRVGGILALSRAMGDFTLKKSLKAGYDPVTGPVSALPDVKVGYLHRSSFGTVILACDGIWDVMSSEEAIEVAEAALVKKENPAETLVHRAFQKHSSDNLTCLVIRIHPNWKPPLKSAPIITKPISTFLNSIVSSLE